MRISNNFHMSQVDGAKKKKRGKLMVTKTSKIIRRKWNLGIKELQHVEEFLGPWKIIQVQDSQSASSMLWPRRLRRRLLIGRNLSVGIKKRPALFASGPISSMLHRFEDGIAFNLQHRRKGEAIEQLFPLGSESCELNECNTGSMAQRSHKATFVRQLSCGQTSSERTRMDGGGASNAADSSSNASKGKIMNPYLKQSHRMPPSKVQSRVESLSLRTKRPVVQQVYDKAELPNIQSTHETVAVHGPSVGKISSNPYHIDNCSTVNENETIFHQSQITGTSNPNMGNDRKLPCKEPSACYPDDTTFKNNNSGTNGALPCVLDHRESMQGERLQQDVLDDFRLPSQDSSSSESDQSSAMGDCDDKPAGMRSEGDEKIDPIQNLSFIRHNDADEDGFVLPTPESSSDDGSIEVSETSGKKAKTQIESLYHEVDSSRFAFETTTPMSGKSLKSTTNNGFQVEPVMSSFRNRSVDSESPQTIVNTKRRKVLAIEDTPESSAKEYSTACESTNNSEGFGIRLRNHVKHDSSHVAHNTQEAVHVKTTSSFAIEDTPDSRHDIFPHNLKTTGAGVLSGVKETQQHNDVDPETVTCAVCRSNTILADDLLILCDGRCNLAVHVSCYSANIPDTKNKWFCDRCALRRNGVLTDNIRCSLCGATKGALKQLDSKSWACIRCPAESQGSQTTRHLRRPFANVNPMIDQLDDTLALRRRREKLMEKYVFNEADGPSDMSQDDDPDVLQAIEDEEAGNAFINDSSQLGYTQDDLDKAGVDIEVNAQNHIALDSEHEKMRRFDTPLLNRRMRNRRQTWSTSQGSESGLGNMHFIRSVLEHHRQGGDVEDIEAVYRELETNGVAHEDS